MPKQNQKNTGREHDQDGGGSLCRCLGLRGLEFRMIISGFRASGFGGLEFWGFRVLGSWRVGV